MEVLPFINEDDYTILEDSDLHFNLIDIIKFHSLQPWPNFNAHFLKLMHTDLPI